MAEEPNSKVLIKYQNKDLNIKYLKYKLQYFTISWLFYKRAFCLLWFWLNMLCWIPGISLRLNSVQSSTTMWKAFFSPINWIWNLTRDWSSQHNWKEDSRVWDGGGGVACFFLIKMLREHHFNPTKWSQ